MNTRIKISPRVNRLAIAAACATMFASADKTHAATIVKQNNTTALNLTGSWVGGAVPGAADIAQWNSTVTGANSSAIGGNLSWQGISITNPGGAITITATGTSTLTLGSSGIAMGSATQSLTISAPVVLGSAQTWNVGTSRTLNVSSAVTGGAANTITKSGAGTLTLSSSTSNFSGGVTLSAGTLNLNQAAALGTGLLTVNGGTMARTVAGTPTMAISGQTWGGNFTLAGVESINFGTGAVSMGASRTLTISGSGTYTQGGAISGSGFSLTTQNASAGATITGALVLNGANTYDGGTNINGALVRFGASALPTTGTVTIGANGALSIDGAFPTLAATLANAQVSNSSSGAFALAADNTEAFDPGATNFNAISLGAALGSTAVYTGALTPALSTYRVGGGGGTINFSGTGAFTGLSALVAGNGGGGTVVVSGDNNTFTGATTIALGTLQLGGGGTSGNLGSSAITNTGTLAFNRSDDISFSNTITGAGAINKLAANKLTLTNSNTNTGVTRILGGTLAIGATNALGTGSTLNFGNNTNAGGTLELASFDQTVAGLTVTTNGATVNSLNIGAAQKLTVGGNVTIGTSGNGPTTLNSSGGGSLEVSHNTSLGEFRVGGYTGSTAGSGNLATADLSGLGSVTIALNTTDGIVRVNNASGTNSTGIFSTLILPTTGAGNTTITAATLAVGDSAQNNGAANQVNSLVLGSGTNTIQVNAINIGTGTRDLGSIKFGTANGSLVIRNAAGTGPATLNMANTGGATGVSGLAGNTFDVLGHSADIELTALSIGTQNRGHGLNNTFGWDKGTLKIASLTASSRTATPGNTSSAFVTNTTVTIGSVNSTLLDTAEITGGILGFATATGSDTSTLANILNSNATLNIGGGTVTIGNTGGNSIRMASASLTTGTTPQSNVATATINITGGATTMTGNIVHDGGTGTATSTLKLSGGSLDMSNAKIGGATAANNITNLLFESGTLSNVNQINNGAVLNKTTPGSLVLAGNNAYTGGTTVTGGTLIAASNSALGTGAVTVNGTGQILAIAGLSAVNVGGIGNLTIPTANTLSLSEIGDQFTLDALANFTLGDITLDLNNAFNTPGTYTVIDSSIAGNALGTTTTFAGADQVNFTYSFSIIDNDAVLSVQAIPEPSTLVLGGLALLGFAGVGLRRRRLNKQLA